MIEQNWSVLRFHGLTLERLALITKSQEPSMQS
jgi:hypothetical protein